MELIGRRNNLNRRSSKFMMILLLVFLLFATASLIWSLEYQITIPENRYGTYLPPHGSNQKATYIDGPIAKESKVILVVVVTISIGFIFFAIYCIRRNLYGRVEVVSFVLSLVYWAAGVFVMRL